MLSVGSAKVNLALSEETKYKINYRAEIIRNSYNVGFRVMHSPRIGYGALLTVPNECWATDVSHTQKERQKRESDFIRHFNNFSFEALKDFGEQMSIAHGLSQLPKNNKYISAAAMNSIALDRYLWREGLEAEEKNVKVHSSAKIYQKKLRALLADWVDFDIAGTHFAYGYNILCTGDKGGPSSNSIFAPFYAGATTGVFQLQIMNISELSAYCWNQYGFPIKLWT